MSGLLKYFFTICLIITSFTGFSQSFSVEIVVTDSLKNAVPEAFVEINGSKKFAKFSQTNKDGILFLNLSKGVYNVQISHPEYASLTQEMTVKSNLKQQIVLSVQNNQLEEIVITAKESKGLITSSKIDHQAMAHLQPSSFADLMELLPGGKAQDPVLTANNPVLIREFAQPGSQYTTGSLGVQFMMDGNPINSAADMQVSTYENHFLNSNYAPEGRNITTTGVDMRTLSTNDIEDVEIIRGIPSASYGDLSSGLVLINRKSGKTEWQSRLKIDGFSKLYYLAKGFQLRKNWSINTSLDFLNAKADPRIMHENYKRFSGSVRSNAYFDIGFHQLKWQSFLDYNIGVDDETVDPDSGYAKVDAYQNKKQYVSFANNFDYKIHSGFFNRFRLNTSLRQGFEDLAQTKLTQFSGPTAISIATEAGVNDGYFPELTYVSYLKTEGRPLDASLKFIADGAFYTGNLSHDVEAGVDYRYSKTTVADKSMMS